MGLLLVAMLMGAGADVPPEPRPGVLHGKVVDVENGQPIPDVLVTARSGCEGQWIAVTDAAGRFHIPERPRGFYTLTFEKEAFAPLSVSDPRLRGDRRVRVDAKLAPETRPSEYCFDCVTPVFDVSANSTGISVGEDFLRRVPVHGP